MPQGAEGEGESALEGEVDSSPADLFENQLLADAAPFRNRPMIAGPGRPKGSPNKRTLDMRELYLRSGFPHPLLWMGSMLRQGVDNLAVLLKCDPLDAAEILRKIAADALPYIESKMPTKVTDGDGKPLPVLLVGNVLAGGKVIEARQDGAMAIDDDLVAAIVEDQRLSDADAAKSDAEKSDTQRAAAD